MENQGKWVVNISEDGIWSSIDEFNTKEQAITFGKTEFEDIYEDEVGEKHDSATYKKVFYVGQIEKFIPYVNVDSVLDNVVENAYDEVGEVVEGFLGSVSKEEYGFLEERLNDAFKTWLDETKNHPTFWKIVNVEKIEF